MNPCFERGPPVCPKRGKETQALTSAGPVGTVLATCPNDWYPCFKLVRMSSQSYTHQDLVFFFGGSSSTFQGNIREHTPHPFGFHLVIAGDSGSASRPASSARASLETDITACHDSSSTVALQNDNVSLFPINNTSREDPVVVYIYPPATPVG